MNLIKGKWYKLSSGKSILYDTWWINFNSIDNTKVTVNEYINNEGIYKKAYPGCNFGTPNCYTYEEVSVSEIKHLLPKDYKFENVTNYYFY